MNEGNAIVQVRSLSKRFGQIQALDGVNLDIHPGRIIGLVGANGSGKSTLLRHIIGFYLPDAGNCTMFGVEAAKLGCKELARIGYVHQEGALTEWMLVEQLIRYVSAYYEKWNRQLEEKYIRQFDISLGVRVGTLSPGQRQKLAILLAIGFEPELLILDEPASALDPIARSDFLDLLLDIIQKENRTIIISSHILSDIEKVIDHIWIMGSGKIIRDSGFDELREEFARVKIISLDDELPSELPFKGVVECRRSKSQAVLILQGCRTAEVEAKARELNCKVEIEPLSFEEIYKIIVSGAEGGK